MFTIVLAGGVVRYAQLIVSEATRKWRPSSPAWAPRPSWCRRARLLWRLAWFYATDFNCTLLLQDNCKLFMIFLTSASDATKKPPVAVKAIRAEEFMSK